MSLAVQWANQAMNLNIVNVNATSALERSNSDSSVGEPQLASAVDRRRVAVADTGVDVIRISGILVSRAAHMDPCTPMTSYEGVRSAVNQAVADPLVEHIVLDIDSAGGTASGAFELADDIRAASLVKPVTALANFSAYSAAYLIAAAATEVIVSATSGVGSIGVRADHLDTSKADEQKGIKVTTVFAGAHKNDLTPHEPINDQSMKVLTDMVQSNYARFVDAVARYRGMTTQAVKDTEAGLYFGKQAVDAGLANTVESPQAAVNRIAAQVRGSRADRSPSGSSTRRTVATRAAAMNMRVRI
ncbi:S49 family peptidase [Paraburkholderia sacchari]|uniref:S49 family peptidase n=1 Tax=Paraburkholderia sacchari TaxID=159450 RepID=UPI001FD565E1|nr:S49 family peptidase [Paraburkholderia sacchari]